VPNLRRVPSLRRAPGHRCAPSLRPAIVARLRLTVNLTALRSCSRFLDYRDPSLALP
jgi:hypothetical protein